MREGTIGGLGQESGVVGHGRVVPARGTRCCVRSGCSGRMRVAVPHHSRRACRAARQHTHTHSKPPSPQRAPPPPASGAARGRRHPCDPQSAVG